MENQTQKSGDFLTSGDWNPEKIFNFNFKIFFLKKFDQ